MFGGCGSGSATAYPASGSRGSLRAVQDPTLLRMAQCMRQTFVNMNHECTPFDLVGDHAKSQSACLMNYDEAKEKSEDDPC